MAQRLWSRWAVLFAARDCGWNARGLARWPVPLARVLAITQVTNDGSIEGPASAYRRLTLYYMALWSRECSLPGLREWRGHCAHFGTIRRSHC